MKYDQIRFATTAIAFFLFSAGAVCATEFPYTARITQRETFAYSSPGENGYETSRLKAGEKVEVYQINDDGWCAIRPPLGSFSWVSGLYLDVGLDNVGTVLVDRLSSRIGSQLVEHCKTIQVQLKQGEKVVLLGRLDTPENSASPVWYKIHPPKGEFRWIRVTSLSPIPREFQALVEKLRRENDLTRGNAEENRRRKAKDSDEHSAGEIVQAAYERDESGEYHDGPPFPDDQAFEGETLPEIFADEPPEDVAESVDEDSRHNVPKESEETEVDESAIGEAGSVAGADEESGDGDREFLEEVPETTILRQALENRRRLDRSAGARQASTEPEGDDPAKSVETPRAVPDNPDVSPADGDAFSHDHEFNREFSEELSERVGARTGSSGSIVNPRIAPHIVSEADVPRQGVPVPATPFQRSLTQLRQEVHYVMNRPTEPWVFDALIQKGDTLYRSAATETDRTRVYQLLSTLDKARHIRRLNAARRYGPVASGAAMTHAALLSNANRHGVSRNVATGNRNFAPGNLPTSHRSRSAAAYSIPRPQYGSREVSAEDSAANEPRRTEMRGNRVPTPVADVRTEPPAPSALPNHGPNASVPQGEEFAQNDAVADPEPTPVPVPMPEMKSSRSQAEGRLGWFSHRPEGHPPFALVNDGNEIVAYVTPEPGVNLTPYINKKVGINGIAGIYIQGKRSAPHIGAKTVTEEPNRY